MPSGGIKMDVVQFWNGEKPEYIELCMRSVRRVYPQVVVHDFEVREGCSVRSESDRARFDYLAKTTEPTLYLDCDVYLKKPLDLPDSPAFGRWLCRYVDIWAIYTHGKTDVFKEIYKRLTDVNFNIPDTHIAMQNYRCYPPIERAYHLHVASSDKFLLQKKYKKLLEFESEIIGGNDGREI